MTGKAILRQAAGVPLLEYGLNRSCPGIFCFTTTRHGGVSTGSYASMNCTPYTGDDPGCVERNRERLLAALPQQPAALVIPYQTHGTRVLSIDGTFLSADAGQRHALLQGVDALTTDRPGVCLCISTADCIPILLYDRCHRAVAAIHAGWRGTVAGIVTHTLQQMCDLYGTAPGDLVAVIGPGISRSAFEVGGEVADAFARAGFPMQDIADYDSATGKYHIDLPRANQFLLASFGIPEPCVEMCGICTYTRHAEFFSARRLGIRSGRLLTGIMLEA